MKPALSPKKYLETKARTLPIYKCLVSKGWEKAGMADVVIMRQHVNGNLTGANFLVDLKCLGVKDAHWFFNEDNQHMLKKFSTSYFEEIDYTLAHNIVYAGYEFALEFDIQPHKDFAVAKYILEEDTDDIPLIDIETGDDGIPHLIEHSPGQHSDALLKLKKNAGEGNYHYTAAIGFDRNHAEPDDDDDDDDEYDDEDDDEDNREEISLHDISDGDLTLRLAKLIPFPELTDKELIAGRKETDRLICDVELQVRFYNYVGNPKYEEPSFMEEECELLPDEYLYAEGLNEKNYEEGFQHFADMNHEIANQKLEPEEDASVIDRYLQQDTGNILFLSLVYEMVIFHQLPVSRELLNRSLQPLAHLPVVQLLQAIDSVINGTEPGKWQPVIEATNIQKAFPNLAQPGTDELMLFWGLQIIHQVRSGNLPLAMAYFGLYSEINSVLIHTHLFFFILKEIMPPLTEAVDKAAEKIRKVVEDAEKKDS